MQTDTRLTLTPQFILGVCLVLFGVLLSLDRMDLVDTSTAMRFWPVVLIAVGAWIVIERGATGHSFSGFLLIFIGGLLLLNSLGLARVRFWELIWPFIIVLVGARLIMHATGHRHSWRRIGLSQDAQGGVAAGSVNERGTISTFSVLGGSKRASDDKPFRGGDMTSIMGGTQLDLRQAVIEPGEQAVINVFALMGGHEIWVPPGWMVVSEVMAILGGVDDKRLPLPAVDATPRLNSPTPRLVLQGTVLLGGLTIKS
jgi:predicted membrane protein